MPPHIVEVWDVPLAPGPETLEAAGRCLSDDERARAARFHFDRDRRRFIAARAALRALLGRALGVAPADLQFSYDAHGKPSIGGRGTPSFNVAHSGDLALVALASDGRLGIDVEMTRPMDDAPRIAARYFAPEECAALARLDPEAASHAFFLCWTRKEAFVKALGLGLSHPLDAFAVTVDPGTEPRLLRSEAAGDELASWSLRDLSRLPDWAAALAVDRPLVEVRRGTWRWDRDAPPR